MSLLQALLLGILQGLTEFIPVSSSGHLVLAQYLGGVLEPGITLEVIVHFGTLLSIVWVFREDLKKLIYRITSDAKEKRLAALLVVGTIPTGVIGVLMSSFFKDLYESPLLVALMLITTGFILWLLTLLPEGRKDEAQIKWYDSFLIGICQGLAIIPGISRSGLTITAAKWRGLQRETAVKFSFFLSLPAILGAALWESIELYQGGSHEAFSPVYLISALAAAGTGILAIKFFIRMLAKGKFHYFAYYCWLIGSTVLLLELLR